MVLGLKIKNRKSPYVQLDYIINLIEIKPWPPSQSLRSLRSALIQWEHGDKVSGSTKAVAPSFVSGSGVGEGKIEFKESFRVHVTLSRDMSIKAGESETFLKNCIEFNMYEPRRDKTVKGPLLATAIIDFAEYGIVEESLRINVPMNCKRTFGNTAQPMLFLKIQTVEKIDCVRSSSSRGSLIIEGSIEKNRSESVSALMNEEYAEEAEAASITDDDISSQSSMAAASSTFGSNRNSTPQRENGSEAICGSSGNDNDQEILVEDKRSAKSVYKANASLDESPRILSSTYLHSELENARTTLSNARNSRFSTLPQKAESYSTKLSNSFIANDGTNEEFNLHEKVPEKNVKSFGSSLDSGFSNGSVRTSKLIEKFKNFEVLDQNSGRNLRSNERENVSKIHDLEHKIQVLEGELKEAAAIEVSLYSVVAEHGSSINKVHAPARRLSRLYLHAYKENSVSRRASAARSIVSGLILVAKACGNDVPRLTFWLSNSVVLRAIICKTSENDQEPLSAGKLSKTNDGIVEKGNNEIISSFKWKKESSLQESRSDLQATFNEWEDDRMVTSILEKVESWIFSRIIESIWWQTLVPYMQSTTAKGMTRVVDSESGSCDHEQVNSSLELWKMAFMDACERICPVRSAGHDCGCLHMLSTLIMEQCMGRLDVAMFNAILRESGDEIPTDPVSDPISDPRVLPIPSGKASFGAGAQLKKTIGNWSRWLTDLFGIDNNSLTYENEDYDTSFFNSFRLLNALSELMMLPKDMLLSNTIRNEVCPAFGIPLIKRILDSFLPDEFCPDPIPEVVLEVLDSKDLLESGKDCVTSLPCPATRVAYHPPSTYLIKCILGDGGNRAQLSRARSSILQKSNTSDDELDELDSPLTLIIDSSTKPVWTLEDAGNRNTIRYQLLREVWNE